MNVTAELYEAKQKWFKQHPNEKRLGEVQISFHKAENGKWQVNISEMINVYRPSIHFYEKDRLKLIEYAKKYWRE